MDGGVSNLCPSKTSLALWLKHASNFTSKIMWTVIFLDPLGTVERMHGPIFSWISNTIELFIIYLSTEYIYRVYQLFLSNCHDWFTILGTLIPYLCVFLQCLDFTLAKNSFSLLQDVGRRWCKLWIFYDAITPGILLNLRREGLLDITKALTCHNYIGQFNEKSPTFFRLPTLRQSVLVSNGAITLIDRFSRWLVIDNLLE